MPYIKIADRVLTDEWLEDAPAAITADAGQFAYLLSQLFVQFVQAQGSNFAAHALLVGVVNTATHEHERRLLHDYENTKRAENGDVYQGGSTS